MIDANGPLQGGSPNGSSEHGAEPIRGPSTESASFEEGRRSSSQREEGPTPGPREDEELTPVPKGVLLLDADLRVTSADESFQELFDTSMDEIEERSVFEIRGGLLDLPPLRALLETASEGRTAGDVSLERNFGSLGRCELHFEARVLAGSGLTLLTVKDRTQRKRRQRLMTEQARLMELIASGAPLQKCLTALCEAVHRLNNSVRASILLADEERNRFTQNIAPDLGSSFGEGLEGAPINDLCIGTCGEAVFSGERVVSTDIKNDETWSKEWRTLCVAHGVRACFSAPIWDAEGEPQGSLMLCFDEPREASEWERRLADFGTRVACIALEREESREELREREEYLHALFRATPECIKVVADDGTLLQMNPAGLDMVEADAASSVIGDSVYDLIAPEDRQRFRAFNERICQGERETLQFDIIGLKGSRRHMESHAAPLRLSGGDTVQVALTRDITERKRTREALRDSENRLRLATKAAELGVFEWDVPNDQVSWENDRMYEIFRHPRDAEPINADTFSSEVAHPNDADAFEAAVEEALESDQFYFVGRFRRGDGELRWIELTGRVQRGPEGAPVRMPGIAADITEQKQTEQRLRALNETLEERVETRTRQVRELTSRVTLAEQRDRERISRLLHDDLQQRLYGSHLQISSLREALLDRGKDGLAGKAEEIEGRIEEVIQALRRLSVGMSPPVLESEGLTAALEWLQSHMEEIQGLEVDFSAEKEFQIEEEMRVLLFQTVRELLRNVYEHIGINQAAVELTEKKGELLIQIGDKGKGFDPEKLKDLHPEEGFGLTTARERVRLFGGDVETQSVPGEGTKMTVRVPLDRGSPSAPDPLPGNGSSPQNREEEGKS